MLSAGSSVVCDQAVFTSIRTPTGQGYRIVAASAGVRADEKSEITTRAPSHGNLYDDGPDPVGLLGCRLTSGRFCVGYVCHAGVEHTGRGGQRVYTHMALLDETNYRSFDSNPVMVHSAIGKLVRETGPLIKPPVHLEPLALPFGTFDLTAPECAGWIWPLAAMLLDGHRVVLTGEKAPLALLNWTMLGLPRGVRERFNVSANLRFSPSRGMHLVLMRSNDPQLPRQLAGQQVQSLACNTTPPATPDRLQSWFGLLERWRREGRLEDVARLTSRACADATVDTLGRLAAICEDVDLLNTAGADMLDEITSRHSPGSGQGPAEQTLIQQLHSRAEQVRSSLHQTAEAS